MTWTCFDGDVLTLYYGGCATCYLRKYGVLPCRRMRFFGNISPRCRLIWTRLVPKHHLDFEWAKLKLAPCELFDEIVDPAALLDDKSIGFCGDEMLSIYKPEVLAVCADDVKHSRPIVRRNLDETTGGSHEDRRINGEGWQCFLRRIGGSPMATKEIGRLFTYSTLSRIPL